MDETVAIERLEDQISLYDRKSRHAQRVSNRIRMFLIIAGPAIAVLAPYTPTSLWVRLTVPILGAGIAMSIALLGVFRFDERAAEYRRTTELLKREKSLFMSRAEPYVDEDASRWLETRIEELVGVEHAKWASASSKQKRGTGSGGPRF